MNKIADITKEYNLKVRKSTKAKNVVIKRAEQM
jgi:hypothetical protein